MRAAELLLPCSELSHFCRAYPGEDVGERAKNLAVRLQSQASNIFNRRGRLQPCLFQLCMSIFDDFFRALKVVLGLVALVARAGCSANP